MNKLSLYSRKSAVFTVPYLEFLVKLTKQDLNDDVKEPLTYQHGFSWWLHNFFTYVFNSKNRLLHFIQRYSPSSFVMLNAAPEGSRQYRYDNRSLDYPVLAITDFPFGISEVFDDAKDVFRKVLGKMIAKKRLVGIESGWYW